MKHHLLMFLDLPWCHVPMCPLPPNNGVARPPCVPARGAAFTEVRTTVATISPFTKRLLLVTCYRTTSHTSLLYIQGIETSLFNWDIVVACLTVTAHWRKITCPHTCCFPRPHCEEWLLPFKTLIHHAPFLIVSNKWK